MRNKLSGYTQREISERGQRSHCRGGRSILESQDAQDARGIIRTQVYSLQDNGIQDRYKIEKVVAR